MYRQEKAGKQPQKEDDKAGRLPKRNKPGAQQVDSKGQPARGRVDQDSETALTRLEIESLEKAAKNGIDENLRYMLDLLSTSNKQVPQAILNNLQFQTVSNSNSITDVDLRINCLKTLSSRGASLYSESERQTSILMGYLELV